MRLTSIITVNYNQPRTTMDLLKSISEHCNDTPLEVILIDNTPKEDFENKFLECCPQLIYIKSDKNLGFAGANNIGFSRAKGDFIFLLNNDTEVTKSLIPTLIKELDNNNDIGLISPLIKYFDDKNLIQFAGYSKMNYMTARTQSIGDKEKDIGQYKDVSREVGFCHGAAVMCRRTDLVNAGFMDVSYFLYYEELDWCEKFKRIGKKIWFTGKGVVYHKESISVGKHSPLKIYFITRNRMLFIRKNTDAITTILFGIYYSFLVIPKQIFFYLIKFKFDLVIQSIRGLFWNYTHSKTSKKLGYRI